jgi:SulP family sulfate permease
VNTVKFSFDGSEYRSMLDREPGELAILAKHGHEIQGVTLQSYLFFGSADRLYQQVKSLFASRPDCRFLLFDFRLVTGIDSSAIHSFTKIQQAAVELGARLVLVDLSPELRERFGSLIAKGAIVAEDLDHALEACEKEVIASHARASSAGQGLHDWFTQALGSSAFADRLIAYCQRLEIREGEVVARQGDPADCMHFILEGRIGIIVKLDDGRALRVRSLGPHTTIGEMGLITRQLRSATIRAEVDSVLYALSVEAYERLKAEDRPLHQALLTYVVTVMAERLNFASTAIGVLRR